MTQPQSNSEAVRFFHEALAAEQNNDLTNAFQLLIASVNADPTLPGAWNNLGLVLTKLAKYPAALAAFKRALILAPDAAMPLANYAWALQLAGRSEEARDIVVLKLMHMDPDTPANYTNLAQINLTLNHPDRALLAADTALHKGDKRPECRLVKGLAQLRLGQYAEGFINYEARMEVNPVLKLLANYPYPVWRGEDISNKTLFIPCEQGLGDSVMLLPFIIAASKLAKAVVVHTHPPTLKLYQRNLPGSKVTVYPTPKELPKADVYCPAFSLPIALRLTDEEIPKVMHKLKHAPVHFQGLKKRDLKDLHIGIAWAGDPAHDNDRWRSANLEAFLRLAEIPNARLFSLQVGARRGDLDVLGTHGSVTDLASYIRDVNDTASLISQHIDVVVTVDTSVGHIAGCVGKKTFLLHGANSVDWRWGLDGEGVSAWYPNTIMMRQETAGDWVGLIERVKRELDT